MSQYEYLYMSSYTYTDLLKSITFLMPVHVYMYEYVYTFGYLRTFCTYIHLACVNIAIFPTSSSNENKNNLQ